MRSYTLANTTRLFLFEGRSIPVQHLLAKMQLMSVNSTPRTVKSVVLMRVPYDKCVRYQALILHRDATVRVYRPSLYANESVRVGDFLGDEAGGDPLCDPAHYRAIRTNIVFAHIPCLVNPCLVGYICANTNTMQKDPCIYTNNDNILQLCEQYQWEFLRISRYMYRIRASALRSLAQTRLVPSWILKNSANVRYEFLKGVFANADTLETESIEFVGQIEYLLSSIGARFESSVIQTIDARCDSPHILPKTVHRIACSLWDLDTVRYDQHMQYEALRAEPYVNEDETPCDDDFIDLEAGESDFFMYMFRVELEEDDGDQSALLFMEGLVL